MNLLLLLFLFLLVVVLVSSLLPLFEQFSQFTVITGNIM
jgi:hypothetical protein